MSNNKPTKEVRHYKGKKNSDFVNFPISLRRAALSAEEDEKILEAPISSLRILFKTLNDISNDQFQGTRQGEQLDLFEADFKTENNTFARFTFSVTDIDKNKDYKSIAKGLEFLENYKKGWYKSVNSKGKIIKSYGGLISSPNISEGKISFLMSSYWVEKVMDIPAYNPAFFNTPWILSNPKQVLFYLWLLEIPDTGSVVSFIKFQHKYKFNYANATTLAKNFLKRIKEKLDRSSNVSFNYKTKGDNITIAKYYTKKVDLDLNENTIKKQEITQKLHYWKVRHKLTSNNIDVLKSLINIDPVNFKIFQTSYTDFISKCKKERKKATDYIGADFIQIFQDQIIITYKASVWSDISKDGYPLIK